MRRSPDAYGIYVAHPISGIRVARIHEMQARIRHRLSAIGAALGLCVTPFFPMRTSHLTGDGIGVNECDESAGLFAHARHFTFQNRLDALRNADAVLVNFDLPDDGGVYRLSKGIPFDYGWATACGKPFVGVIGRDNPNRSTALDAAACLTEDLEFALDRLCSLLVHTVRSGAVERIVAEIFEFPDAADLDHLAALAQADARRRMGDERAIVSILPGGNANPNWHGQVGEVSDWVLSDVPSAEKVVRHLLADDADL